MIYLKQNELDADSYDLISTYKAGGEVGKTVWASLHSDVVDEMLGNVPGALKEFGNSLIALTKVEFEEHAAFKE